MFLKVRWPTVQSNNLTVWVKMTWGLGGIRLNENKGVWFANFFFVFCFPLRQNLVRCVMCHFEAI